MVPPNGKTFLLDFTAKQLGEPEYERFIMVIISAVNAKGKGKDSPCTGY